MKNGGSWKAFARNPKIFAYDICETGVVFSKKKREREEHFCPSVLHRSKKMLDVLFSIYRGENECFVYSFHCESEGHLYALEM